MSRDIGDQPDWLPAAPRRAFPQTLKVVLIMILILGAVTACSVLLAIVSRT